MNVNLVLVVVIVTAVLLYLFLSSIGRRIGSAAAKAATGKGTFVENIKLAFKGMEPLSSRIVDSPLGGYVRAPSKSVEVKGLFPVEKTRQVAFVTSVFDETDGERRPVLSAIDLYQEPESSVYQHSIRIGQKVAPMQGFSHWTLASRIIPGILQPPVGGARRLSAIVRLVDVEDMPPISLGAHQDEHAGLLWQATLPFEHSFAEKGYDETAEHRDRARALSVAIGMAVAMADGSLDPSEDETIRRWTRKAIAAFPAERRRRLEALYDEAMQDTRSLAANGRLRLTDLTRELNGIAEPATKYETVELCFKVLAADGIVHPQELRVINTIADDLGLDFGQIGKMRDKTIINLGPPKATQHAAAA